GGSRDSKLAAGGGYARGRSPTGKRVGKLHGDGRLTVLVGYDVRPPKRSRAKVIANLNCGFLTSERDGVGAAGASAKLGLFVAVDWPAFGYDGRELTCPCFCYYSLFTGSDPACASRRHLEIVVKLEPFEFLVLQKADLTIVDQLLVVTLDQPEIGLLLER